MSPQGQAILAQISLKLGWLQVSSKCFPLYFLKGIHLGICRMESGLFIFLASHLSIILSVTLLIYSKSY